MGEGGGSPEQEDGWEGGKLWEGVGEWCVPQGRVRRWEAVGGMAHIGRRVM